MKSRIGAVMAILAALALAGCGGGGGGEPDAAPSSRPTKAESTATQAPWQALDGPLGRCGPQPADVADAGFAPTVLKDPDLGRIPAVTAGSGTTVAVLLHQTDGNGLCGWLAYAADLVAQPGVQVRAIVDRAPAGSRFEAAESGHGYDLLLDADAQPLPLAETVEAWIRG